MVCKVSQHGRVCKEQSGEDEELRTEGSKARTLLRLVRRCRLTSSRNLGLSGMNFKATMDTVQGRAQTMTNTLQLWK